MFNRERPPAVGSVGSQVSLVTHQRALQLTLALLLLAAVAVFICLAKVSSYSMHSSWLSNEIMSCGVATVRIEKSGGIGNVLEKPVVITIENSSPIIEDDSLDAGRHFIKGGSAKYGLSLLADLIESIGSIDPSTVIADGITWEVRVSFDANTLSLTRELANDKELRELVSSIIALSERGADKD